MRQVFKGDNYSREETIRGNTLCIFNYLIKNTQTTIALTFLTHIISAIDGVMCLKCYHETKLFFSIGQRLSKMQYRMLGPWGTNLR